MMPYEFFKAYTTIMMHERYSQFQLGMLWRKEGRTVTPRAEQKLQKQVMNAADMVLL